MKNDTIFNMRLEIDNAMSRKSIAVIRGNTKAHTIHASLSEGGKVYSLEDVATVWFKNLKPDGSYVFGACQIDANEIKYTITTQDINIEGECDCEFELIGNDGAVINTPHFSINVVKSNYPTNYVESQNTYSGLEQAYAETVKRTNDAEKAATNAENKSNQAQESAERAAEYLAEAVAAAESAEGVKEYVYESRTSANASEQNCIKIQEEIAENIERAEGYKDSAAESAEAAAISAGEAAFSATEANESMTGANVSSVNAKDSEVKAKESEDNAKLSEEAASAYEQLAEEEYLKCKALVDGVAGGIIPVGSVLFENLPELKDVGAGWMYDIKNDFVTTDDFIEGAGISVAAGANVYKTALGKWDLMSTSKVAGVKGSAETAYRDGYVEIGKADVGLGNADNTSDANKPISTLQKAAIDDLQGKIDTINGLLNTINNTLSTIQGEIESLQDSVDMIGYPVTPE